MRYLSLLGISPEEFTDLVIGAGLLADLFAVVLGIMTSRMLVGDR